MIVFDKYVLMAHGVMITIKAKWFLLAVMLQ
nr:hypothetical protein [Mucilaginibacter sp. X5P1]